MENSEFNSLPNIDSPHSGISISELLAWVVILGLTSFMAILVSLSYAERDSKERTQAQVQSVELEAKFQLGMKEFGIVDPKEEPKSTDIDGTLEDRLAKILLLGDQQDIATAQNELMKLDELVAENQYKLTKLQLELRDAVGRLLENRAEANPFDPQAIPEADQQLLTQQFGFVGKLALAPVNSTIPEDRKVLNGQAQRSFVFTLLIFLFGCFWCITGLIASISVLSWLAVGKTRPVGYLSSDLRSVIYLETFAVWMLIFVGTMIGVEILVELSLATEQTIFLVQPFLIFGSLSALFWPSIRGLSGREIFRDIGWYGNPVRESVAGLFGYLISVPILVAGVVISAIVGFSLTAGTTINEELAGRDLVSHPMQEIISSGSVLGILFAYGLACVCAPIVEETVFRGLLFRYLKDRSMGWGTAVSVSIACLVNGLIFASIHPQSLVGIPILTSLAVALSLIRYWRGSLQASIVMHAIHNAAVTTISLVMIL